MTTKLTNQLSRGQDLMLAFTLILAALAFSANSALAAAPAPRWSITSVAAATNFAPGDERGYDEYVLTVTNVGNAPAEGAVSPAVITDALPVGVTADDTNENPGNDETGPRGLALFGLFGIGGMVCTTASPVECTLENPAESVPVGAQMIVTIPVDIAASAPSGSLNTATVSGGGAPAVSVQEADTVSGSDPGFGLSGHGGFDGLITSADGSVDTQAGSHPYAFTTSFLFNTINDPTFPGQLIPAGGQVRDIRTALPPGLVGNPNAVPQCAPQQFYTNGGAAPNGNACPADTALGFADLLSDGGTGGESQHVPIYNLQPPKGTPALFGFSYQNLRGTLSASVRTGSDYGVTIDSLEISQALALTGISVTFWGVPADPSHDGVRGGCLVELTGGSRGSCPSGLALKPFLTLPTSCTGPTQTTATLDSWDTPGDFLSGGFTSHDLDGNPVGLEGCNRLDFSPTVSVQPDTTAASTPAGLDMHVQVPQNENPSGLAEADLKQLTLALPAGISVNPASAGGLAACSEAQIGFERFDPATQTDLFTPGAASCPDASKIGSAEIITPLLPDPLKGSIYLAQQNANPFGSLLALYLVAEGDGVLIKLAGHVEANPATGQLTTTFDNNPQQPFSELKVQLFGGPRAALVTPAGCGSYTASTSLTPWSSEVPAPQANEFPISSGCGGGFSPSFSAGTQSNAAGGYSPFTVAFSRADGEQALGAISVQAPAGLSGMLSSVPLCGEAQANAGSCPSASQIGHTVVAAGAGPEPVVLPEAGKPQDPVYLTTGYKGAPFGLSIVVPAEAGPFNLGTVVVRSAIVVNPVTAAITISSDPIPTILQGIPLQNRSIDVVVDRPGFMFNATSCNPSAVGGTISSAQGASASVSSRYQAAGCTSLPFKPKFTASTQGNGKTNGNGASLTVKIATKQGPSSSGEEANIAKVDVSLPLALSSRLTTLQKACLAATFEANPANCRPESNVGTAVARTPVLPVPLSGPAYLVSHGGEAFPDLVLVLQGDGVKIILTGHTQIKKGITYSRFETVPDQPISSFSLELPEKKFSVLGAIKNLCTTKLIMPTEMTGQNGTVLKQSTKIGVTGCKKAKKPKKKAKKHGKSKR
jgi:hypothetical protein